MALTLESMEKVRVYEDGLIKIPDSIYNKLLDKTKLTLFQYKYDDHSIVYAFPYAEFNKNKKNLPENQNIITNLNHVKIGNNNLIPIPKIQIKECKLEDIIAILSVGNHMQIMNLETYDKIS